MNLLQIRQQFIKLSGRYDLATSSDEDETAYLFDTDAGADFYIQTGSRDLDLELDVPAAEGQYDFALAADTVDVKMQHCRAVHKVYYLDSDSEWVELTQRKVDQAIEDYPELDATDSGTPLVYTVYPLRTSPAAVGHTDLVGLKVYPPTDTATTIRVFGNFYSFPLTRNDDENYWSVNHPDLLTTAALRVLEKFYRNTQGVADYDNVIAPKLRKIDRDIVEMDQNTPLQMNG